MKRLIPTLLITLVAALAPAQTPVLLRTFNNPTPATEDFFGWAIAALGNDRILIGAPYDDTTATNAGAVYLFHTNGTLLTTFTNPDPVFIYPLDEPGQFGSAIATLGSDRVLLGSPVSQKVYLFTTNGALVKTISSSPIPTGFFGQVVVAFGNDRVLIGVPTSNFDPDTYDEAGAAYLYSTNGTLLTTFINPAPASVSGLGFSLAAFGSDRVLIGASGYYPGSAYLFNTNGTLLTTFTNPAPEHFDHFGHSAAAVGTDRVLIGGDSVYLFNTNGTLLLTIPATADRMAMLGNDRVLVGSRGGSAHVFNVNGTFLATLNNPAGGFSVAAIGSEGVIIGAPWDGATNAWSGSVYLFSIPAPVAPSLTIQRTTTNTVAVSWPAIATGFVLQQNTNGVSSVNWSNITVGIPIVGTNRTLIVNPTSGSRFYRLISP
jgi:FG-GAP repeat